MNKLSVIVSLLAVVAISASADPIIQGRGSFSVTGTAGATTYIEPQNGYVRDISFHVDTVSNATCSIYRPRAEYKTKTSALSSSSTTIAIYTPGGSNTVSGFTPTLSGTDYILAKHSGASGWQLRSITSQTGYNSTTKVSTYVVSAAVTLAAGDPVWIVDASDNHTISIVAANDQTDEMYQFVGFRNAPLAIVVPATAGTGATTLSGVYDVEQ